MNRSGRCLSLSMLLIVLSSFVHAGDDEFTFFAIGDPQINIPKWGTAGTERTIEAMNAAPDLSFPYGGKVGQPKGVLIAGDLVDDLRNPANWSLYKSFFDVRGKAKLKFPVFEGVGNHDLDSRIKDGSLSVIEKDFVLRNRSRKGSFNFDESSYHYAWDWGEVRFLNLNVFPGSKSRPVYDRKAPWNNPRDAIVFLKNDLSKHVGKSKRPVVLMWHYGLDGWGREKWWSVEDLDTLEKALRPYNIALILHGHEHRYRKYEWRGYDVLMAPSPQIDKRVDRGEGPSLPKGFVVFRVRAGQLEVAHRTAQGWKEQWRKSLAPADKSKKADKISEKHDGSRREPSAKRLGLIAG